MSGATIYSAKIRIVRLEQDTLAAFMTVRTGFLPIADTTRKSLDNRNLRGVYLSCIACDIVVK